MRRPIIIAGACALGATVAWMAAQIAAPTPPLASVFPAGAVVYIQARDFGTLVRDWNSSAAKREWLASDNYSVFSRSRLFERLATEQQAFGAAAGFAPDMPLVQTVAGGESALAIYSIGDLEFLYATRMPAANVAGTALGRAQSSYESRSSGGRQYFVRRAGGKTAAFSTTDGLLLLATREDLLASALAMIASQPAVKSLPDDPWFTPAASAQSGGDLRILLNMRPLLASPYFRSYWIQRNRSELMSFASAAIDVFRDPDRFREQRTLLRAEPAQPDAHQQAAGQLVGLVPPGMGLYRVWSSPTTNMALDLVADKIVAPGAVSRAQPFFQAPAAADVGATAGSEADLERSIDQPPLAAETNDEVAALRPIVERTGLDALLEIQTSRKYADGVFVGNQAAIVLLAPADWDAAAIQAALPRRDVRVAGRMLILADRKEMLDAVAARIGQPGGAAVSYSALYRHSQELGPYTEMMRMIDATRGANLPMFGGERRPNFFSGNIASLGRTLAGINTVSVAAEDAGASVRERVLYTFGQ